MSAAKLQKTTEGLQIADPQKHDDLFQCSTILPVMTLQTPEIAIAAYGLCRLFISIIDNLSLHNAVGQQVFQIT